MTRTGRVIGLLLLTAFASAAAGPVRKWVDADGRIHFGDAPPPNAASVVVSPEPASHPSSAEDAPEGLRPGERRMLERIEREEREFVEARERSAKELAQRDAARAHKKKVEKAKCKYYRALVREHEHALKQGYRNSARRLHDETKLELYERQAAMYCP
jgi:hypothetical protein